MNVALAGGVGFVLGVLTGFPLGVINVSIVEAASHKRRRFAVGLGLGGALADSIHAGLAFVGVGRLVTARPELVRVLAIVAATMIIGYAVITWRRGRARLRPDDDDSRMVHGLFVGLSLTGPNPAALAAWVAVATALLPSATIAQGLAVAAGVATGSALWFSLLATWVSRLRPDHPVLRALPPIAVAVLLATAVLGIARAFW